uniref:Uncharacterized protein n=1 Tax=Chenopodium quinoa TaxID=63459 RepID=A0A803LLT7_CHEQI
MKVPATQKKSPKKASNSKESQIKGATLQRISKKQLLIKRRLKELEPSEDIFLLPHVTENKVTFHLMKQPIANMLIQKEWKKKLARNSRNTFLAPVANRVIDYKIINYPDNAKEIHNLDWCGYVVNNLCEAMGSFKNKKHKESRSGISGCYLILQLVYFHHLIFRGQPEKTTLPLIKHWSDEKVRERIANEAKASFGQGELQKDFYQVCRKVGQQAYLGDVVENAYRNFADRERRLVSFNLPEGVMTDSEIYDAAKDVKKMKKQQLNVSASNSQVFSKTQRLMEDPKVQRAMDEIVSLYEDLRDVSNVFLSTWEEHHKNSETDPKTNGDNQDDADDPKIINLDDENEDYEKEEEKDLDDENEDSEKEEEKEENDNKEEKEQSE